MTKLKSLPHTKVMADEINYFAELDRSIQVRYDEMERELYRIISKRDRLDEPLVDSKDLVDRGYPDRLSKVMSSGSSDGVIYLDDVPIARWLDLTIGPADIEKLEDSLVFQFTLTGGIVEIDE